MMAVIGEEIPVDAYSDYVARTSAARLDDLREQAAADRLAKYIRTARARARRRGRSTNHGQPGVMITFPVRHSATELRRSA